MTIEKTVQGALRITDIIDGEYITRQYFGYTKKEAIALFKEEIQKESLS